MSKCDLKRAYCKDSIVLDGSFIFYKAKINKAMSTFTLVNLTVISDDMIGEL